jgi:[ribosomal protein S5]-alanine N-acetyltransferase
MTTLDGPKHPPLETARLLLRPIALADAEALYEVFRDPETMRFMDCLVSQKVDDTRGVIERWMFVFPDWHATWAIVLKETGTLIGMINYHHRDPWNRHLEVGYALARQHWRKGLTSEALSAVLDYCFAKLGSNRAEATIHPENIAAIRLAERAGFCCEGGPLRQRKLVAGEYRDVMIYGLLLQDWLLVQAARSLAAAPEMSQQCMPLSTAKPSTPQAVVGE